MSDSIRVESELCAPGSLLRGSVTLLPPAGAESHKVELTVGWETEGKGDTDRGVVFYRVLADGDPVAARATHPFEVQLPSLPLSYNGQLIKIRWSVRVERINWLGGDGVTVMPFKLTWTE